MKKENLLKIFGTEHPPVEKFQEWIIKNNPETLQPWNLPLNSQEEAVIFDPVLVKVPLELVENSKWDSYPDKWVPIESAALVMSCIKEAKQENLSSEQLFLNLRDLENCSDDCKTKLVYDALYNQTIQVLEKHGIYVNKNIGDLKRKFWEKKTELFSDLSQWMTDGNSIERVDGLITIREGWVTNLISKDEFSSLRNAIIQDKIEDMKKNPQNWKIFKASGINLPWSGGASYVERKDKKVKIYKTNLSQQQWKEVEKAVGKGNFLAFFFAIFFVIILLLIFLWWWYKRYRKKKNRGV